MRFILNAPMNKGLLALALCLIFIPFSRFISPKAVIDGNDIYLAWLPLSVTLAVLMLFGRHAVLPLIITFGLNNDWRLDLPQPQSSILLFCQLFGVFVSAIVVRALLGRRWRVGFAKGSMGVRIFWFCFVTPAIFKGSMYLAGECFSFPVEISSFFGSSSVIYMIVDVQGLISASLVFMLLFYYPMRMLLNPRYARTFWRRNVQPSYCRQRRYFTLYWFATLTAILLLLCAPFKSDYIAGYLVPLIFILFFLGVGKLTWTLMSLAWALSAYLLVWNNGNFLQGVQTEYSLAFIMSALISFTICMLYMAQTWARSDLLKRKWQNQAMQDPLTGLPNLRALEYALSTRKQVSLCCLRIDNLEFLSRHYGMMMRVHCKRTIARELQPLLGAKESWFQLPGSELLLVLNGSEVAERLTHIVDVLNHRNIVWNNTVLPLQFGASWSVVDAQDEDLHHTLGQLSWLSERACASRRVLALNSRKAAVSGNTTERVLLLNQIKQALENDDLRLFAQPIVNGEGEGYYEILSRLRSEDGVMTPDKFIPIITQFNLSKRFDMQVLETLFRALSNHPGQRFSVNLMPSTLMQKESASEIIALFERYQVAPGTVVIEITEEQAFSNSETSVNNIQQLREYGCQIAIDDFGTGYANFERLKRVEADIVKIDGCFVRDIMTESMDAMIVKSICSLAKVKHLTVVAEYVETEEQRALLLQLGVDYLQGYLLGKPRPLEELQA